MSRKCSSKASCDQSSKPVTLSAEGEFKDTAAKRLRSSGGVSWVGDELVQKQRGQQCVLHAVNNLVGSICATPKDFERIREEYCRQFRRNKWSLAGVSKRRRPGGWTFNIPLKWLSVNGYKIKAVDGRRRRRAVMRAGRRGAKFLLSVRPPEDPTQRHAICIRDGKIFDSNRGAAPVDQKHWDSCVHTLVKGYQIKEV